MIMMMMMMMIGYHVLWLEILSSISIYILIHHFALNTHMYYIHIYMLCHRFQLPTGTKLSRRFLKTDQIQVIKDFLNLHFADSAIARGEDINSSSCTMIKNFAISTHFPKVELIDMTQTVEAAVSC